MIKRCTLFCLLLAPGLLHAQQGQWTRFRIADSLVAQQVVFSGSEVGYVSGYSTADKSPIFHLFRTSDGGATWKELILDTFKMKYDSRFTVSAPTRRDIFVNSPDYSFLDNTGDYFLVSTDSGVTWSRRNFGPGPRMEDCRMFTAAMGYAYNNADVTIYKTEDSARTWSKPISYQWVSATPPVWSDSERGLFLLYDSTTGVSNWNTMDGGLDWNYNHQAIDTETTLIAAPDAGTLLYYTPYDPALGWQQIRSPYSYYRSTDLGATWEGKQQFAGRVLSAAAIGDAVFFGISDGDTLTMSHPASVFAMSHDGVNWNLDSTSAQGLNIHSIVFTDSAHGWAIGNDPHTAYQDSTVAYLLKYIGAPLLGVRQEAVVERPSIEFSPNPATSVVHFRIGGTESVLRADAIDMLGMDRECPLRFANGVSGDVDISALPPGAYLLRLRMVSGSALQRIIKLP